MHQPLALALFLGAHHVLRAVNDEYLAVTSEDPPIGVPACEAWADPVWRPVQKAMDEVYRSGEAQVLAMPTGDLTISAYRREGLVVGVVTAHLRTAPTPAMSRVPADPASAAA